MAGVISNISNTSYNAKKAISNGLLDAALFLSNVAQLKAILEGDFGMGTRPIVGITMISLSLIMQVVVGILIVVILDIEGAMLQLKRSGGSGGEDTVPMTTADETVEEATGAEPRSRDTVSDEKLRLTRRARRINTALMIFIFLILCVNIVTNGLDLTKPNTLKELLTALNMMKGHMATSYNTTTT